MRPFLDLSSVLRNVDGTALFSERSILRCRMVPWRGNRFLVRTLVPSASFRKATHVLLAPPDVHVHIIPRRAKDFEPLDESELARHWTRDIGCCLDGENRSDHS